MREVGRGYEGHVPAEVIGAAAHELAKYTMLVVGTCDGERHERTGAQKMHRHEHTVVQHWRGLWLDDHYALFVRRCQQSVGELDVVG